MNKQEFHFLSKDGVSEIHAVKWLPDDGQYKAILQITHGMVEYIERYEGFAKFMTSNGYMVVGHDHVGHGHSVSSSEDLGFFPDNNPSDVLVEDMNTLRQMIQKENPDVPYFMFGHSMGSYMLRKYLSRYNENLRGAIICGTGFMPPRTTKMGLALVKVIRKFRGNHYRSKFVTNLTYDKYYKNFNMDGTVPKDSWLTRDQDVVNAYYADPLCSYRFTVNGYVGLLEAVLYDCYQENVDKIPDKLPIFIISGSQDPVGALGSGVVKVYDMFKKSGKNDVTYKLYEGMRHEILNEIGKEEVREDILAWTNVRITT